MTITTFSVAFGAGLASVLSPCVVPLIPSYLTAMAGTSLTDDVSRQPQTIRLRVVRNALMFVLGFSLVLILSGMVATSLGEFVRRYQTLISQIGGLVMVVFGLELLGVVTLGILARDIHLRRKPGTMRGLSALLMGFVFAAGWTPCVGPIWSSILVLASRSQTVYAGGLLLAAYAIGLGLPFLLLAVFLGQATSWTKRLRYALPWIERTSGVLLIALGLLLVTRLYVQIPGLV